MVINRRGNSYSGIGMLAGIYLSENPRTKLAYYSGLMCGYITGRTINSSWYSSLFLDC